MFLFYYIDIKSNTCLYLYFGYDTFITEIKEITIIDFVIFNILLDLIKMRCIVMDVKDIHNFNY